MMIQFTITRAVILLVSFYSFVSVQSFSYVTSSAFVTNTAAAEAATVSASERIPARNIGSSSSGRSGNTVLSMAGGGGVRRRGLEQRRETITPTGRYYSAWVTSRHLFFCDLLPSSSCLDLLFLFLTSLVFCLPELKLLLRYNRYHTCIYMLCYRGGDDLVC